MNLIRGPAETGSEETALLKRLGGLTGYSQVPFLVIRWLQHRLSAWGLSEVRRLTGPGRAGHSPSGATGWADHQRPSGRSWGCYSPCQQQRAAQQGAGEEAGWARQGLGGSRYRALWAGPFRLLKSPIRLSLQWSHRSLHPLFGNDGEVSRGSQPGEGSGKAGNWPLDWL